VFEWGGNVLIVTSWAIAANSHKSWRSGCVLCVEQPLSLAFFEWFMDNVLAAVCCGLHWIKFPNWPRRKWESDDDCEYTPKEYWGDLGIWYHCHIFVPIFDWYYRRQSRKEWTVEVGYDRLKEIFGEKETEFFKEQDEFWAKDSDDPSA
jgi:hypothetical protein